MTGITRGPTTPVAEVVDNFRVGNGTAPFPGAALSQAPAPIIEVSIQCSPDSPESLFVGNEFGQLREVTAGSVEIIPARDLSIVYVMSLGGTATYNYMAGE